MLDPKEQAKLLARRFGGALPSRAPFDELPRTKPLRPFGPELVPDPPPPPPVSRWWLVIPFCIGIWAGFALTQNSEQIIRATHARPLRTVPADRGDVRGTIRVSGNTAARSVAAIRAPRVRGRGLGQMTLIKLAGAGSWVTKGTVVAEFDTQNQLLKLDDQKAKVVQREASILRVKANQQIAREDGRQSILKAEGGLARAKLDLRTTEVKSAIVAARLKMAVEEAEVDLDAARREFELAQRARRSELRASEISRDQELIDQERAEMNIGRMIVEAPIDGMVVLMSNSRGSDISEVSNGDQVRAGMHFMNIVDTSSMVLDAAVNQADSQRFRSGLPVEVRLDAYPNAAFEARVSAVGSLASTNAGGGGGRRGGRGGFSRSGGGAYLRNIDVEISILSNDKRLIPDLSASADVIFTTASDVIRAPREAVFFDDEQAWVEVKTGRGDTFERRRVEAGLISDVYVEIVSGLDPGQDLAVGGRDAQSQSRDL